MIQTAKSWLRYLTNSKPVTAEAPNSVFPYAPYIYNPKRPLFTRIMADAMLCDPHVKFGLYLLKGPILSGSRFLVTCEDQGVKDFVVQQLTRYWTRYAKQSLTSLHYGWHGAEVMYQIQDGMLAFRALKNLSPRITRPIVLDGALNGMEVRAPKKPIYLPTMKCFWTVHARETNRWWGQSRLYGPHIPWYEYNANEGYRDSRSLFFYKCAFDSGVLRYPTGVTTTPTGDRIDNRDIAQQILDSYRNGSGMAIPTSASEVASWDWQRPQSQDVSASFTEYGQSLRDEIWEAMGVPPEIAKAQGTGAYAGRQIPQEAFYSLLQEMVQDLLTDFDEQILTPLCRINFGPEHAPFEIESYGLLRSLEDDRGNHKDDARQPLGVREGGDQTEDPYMSEGPPTIAMSQMVAGSSQRPSQAWLDRNAFFHFRLAR